MTHLRDINNSMPILVRMMDALVSGPALMAGREGFELRRAVGTILADAPDLVRDEIFGTTLLDCFDKARIAGSTIATMDRVRVAMVKEVPVNTFGDRIKLAGIVFSLAEQGTIISEMTFVSRSDVASLMDHMTDVIDEVKLEVCDILDGMDYQYIVALSAAIVQHLAVTERQLPRIVSYLMDVNLPALALANRLYADAERSDELVAENKVVHPAFMPRQIVALSQ